MMYLHLYNLEGRPVLGIVRHEDMSIADNISLCTGLRCDAATEPVILIHHPLGGVFTCGPLAGIYLLDQRASHPRVAAYEASLIWMACHDNLQEYANETTH